MKFYGYFPFWKTSVKFQILKSSQVSGSRWQHLACTRVILYQGMTYWSTTTKQVLTSGQSTSKTFFSAREIRAQEMGYSHKPFKFFMNCVFFVSGIWSPRCIALHWNKGDVPTQYIVQSKTRISMTEGATWAFRTCQAATSPVKTYGSDNVPQTKVVVVPNELYWILCWLWEVFHYQYFISLLLT